MSLYFFITLETCSILGGSTELKKTNGIGSNSIDKQRQVASADAKSFSQV